MVRTKVFINQNDPRLTDNHRQTITKEREHGLGISTISLIEIARLVTAERIILPAIAFLSINYF